MEIVKINPAEFGVQENTAQNIQQQFQPMLDKMVELESEFNEVVKMEVGTVAAEEAARELRLKYVKVRTGTDKIHEQQKAFYLNGGRFVDGWRNAQRFASQGKEDRLKEIENYRAILQEKVKAELKSQRQKELAPFVENVEMFPLADMTEDAFAALLEGQKLAMQAKKEAEAKAEADRLAAVEAERKRIEEQRLENERLKAEADRREKEIAAERMKQERELEKQRIEAEKARKAEADKLFEQQRKAAELQAELDRKKAAEEQAERDRIAEEKRLANEAKKAANAPDKEKLQKWVDAAIMPEINVTQPEAMQAAKEISEKFQAFKYWAVSIIDKIQ